MPDFDFFVDLLSLPRVLQTTLATIPAPIPYLTAPPERIAFWRERLTSSGDFKVGLVWSGDPRHPRDRERSIPLGAFASLTGIEGIRWFSLQKGRAGELKRSPLSGVIADLDKLIFEYADTAAIIENLDLVIAVDTSVAHLAGALGKPVWVLLPFSADWRWMERREDSPWYPTMRLFRQIVAGDWATVLENVRAAMIELMGRRGSQKGSPRTATISFGALRSNGPRPALNDHPVRGIARARRTRVGMMQFVPGSADASRSIEHYGEHLQPHVDMLRALVESGSIVVEVGASIGFHAIALASIVGAGGQVLAIERSPMLRRILRQNIVANDVIGVSVMPAACVRASLDDLQFEKLDVLKASADTDLADLLEGARRTLSRLRPILFLEQRSGETIGTHAGRFAECGYHCWCIEAPLFNPNNFNRRDEDIFGGTKSFALLAVAKEREVAMPAHPLVRVIPMPR